VQVEYQAGGQLSSLLDTDLQYQVEVRGKTVDASYLTTQVPSTSPPRYAVSPGVTLVPVNGLAKLERPWQRYTVIGAGKTGIDAVLFLLNSGVRKERISWIMPNDSWYINREMFADDLSAVMDFAFPVMKQAVGTAKNVREAVLGMEAGRYLLRLDPEVWPTKFKCATVSPEELLQLQSLTGVVRQGRVAELQPNCIKFEDGSTAAMDSTDCLYVDCTADGLVTGH